MKSSRENLRTMVNGAASGMLKLQKKYEIELIEDGFFLQLLGIEQTL